MPTIFATDSIDHVCPYDNFNICRGPACMAWLWTGSDRDRCETDNLVDTEDGPRPFGAPKTPDGEGWEMAGDPYPKGYHRSAKEKLPPAAGQRWVRMRERAEGRCGRVGPDDNYSQW